jgi:hypothetical protein
MLQDASEPADALQRGSEATAVISNLVAVD